VSKKEIKPVENAMASEEVPDGEEQLTITKSELLDLLEASQLEVIQEIKTSEKFSGPVPHPEHMQRYKSIDKTLPHRFTKMAEENIQHMQWVDKYTVVSESIMGFLGWATPTGIAFYSLNLSYRLISDGKSVESIIALLGAFTALAGAFYMKNTKSEKD